MMIPESPTTLIPGMCDAHTEFFEHENSSHRVNNGSTECLSELPAQFVQLLADALGADERAARALDEMGLQGMDRIMKYYRCNYSACDHKPDVTDGGKLGPREYVPCHHRGTCEAENRLCKIPLGFTRRERDVVREIGRGFLDKEICERLDISQDTLRHHKDNASAKAGIERKTSLGIIAHQYKLL